MDTDLENKQEADRVISFSCKPTDTTALLAIKKLRDYGKVRGITFSFLIIQAVKNYVEVLDNK